MNKHNHKIEYSYILKRPQRQIRPTIKYTQKNTEIMILSVSCFEILKWNQFYNVKL